MSAAATPAPQEAPHRYFVDESGDGVVFDSRGRSLIGTGKAMDYFILGMTEMEDWSPLEADLLSLRTELLADPYFKAVPSFQPEQGKTAVMFHAKDDLPEVRREVFKLLLRHEVHFYAVVRSMSAVHASVLQRNERDPSYRYTPNELYDSAVRRLFDKKLHTQPHYECIFASRGKARTRALREQLLRAQRNSRKADGTYAQAHIEVRAMPAKDHLALQVTDYFLWAVQRLFGKQEDRFLTLLWPKVALLIDVDDISQKPYGTYHTRKGPPIDLLKLKSRTVEDLAPEST
jgi:Protein of unknown function (DUF3800)